MSQISHMKSITQINCTIESHEMGHMWDDVMYKISKNHGSQEFVEIWIAGMGDYAQKFPTYQEIS